MEFGQQMTDNRNNSKLAYFQNHGYQFERNKTKTLLLDISSSSNETNFSVDLIEPFVIDKLSDIYLDSFTTYNAKSSSGNIENIGFTLKINEFNNNSNIGNNLDKRTNPTTGEPYVDSKKFNSIFIPNNNSNTAVDDQTGPVTNIAVSHKSKKFNYICSINPSKLTKISGELFDAGTVTPGAAPSYRSPFVDNNGEKNRFIAEFVFVSRDD